MTTSPNTASSNPFQAAYEGGRSTHGELGLSLKGFTRRLNLIAEKYSDITCDADMERFLATLNTKDLYLATACAASSEAAWERFIISYSPFIRRIAGACCGTIDAAEELANSVLSHLSLPDSSGRSRIASYDGRSSLVTWLAVILKRLSIKEATAKHNRLESSESLPQISDYDGMLATIELRLRSSRYSSIIEESLAGMGERLSERERLMLKLRYKQGLQVSQIARLFGVNPSSVSRQLERTQHKLRDEVTQSFILKHGLSAPAIDECIESILENPEQSLKAMAHLCAC
jgi:RNA polymerase sigma-70 factor